MSQEELSSWDLWGIAEDDWHGGWRRTIEEAIDAALADAEVGVPYEIRLFARKRTRNSVHDYRAERNESP
jgi:hypothetical protein